ncbi:MAG TPA: hypothetical protein VEF07_00165, partial [Candidatus Binataceae bacterium]|nr:hypothetical protein [Candidatus Binataceae bacterium]
VIGGFVMMPGFVVTFAPLERFLDPVFASGQTRALLETGLHDTSREAFFAGLSLLIVACGWLLADLTYRAERLSAEKMGEFAGGMLYRLSLNKYYVDEAYNAAIVRPYMTATRAMAWFDQHIIDGVVNLTAMFTVFGAWLSGLFDNYVVDGLVNLAANSTLAAGGRLRRLQTGSINGYLYGILAAVMVILIVRAMLRA